MQSRLAGLVLWKGARVQWLLLLHALQHNQGVQHVLLFGRLWQVAGKHHMLPSTLHLLLVVSPLLPLECLLWVHSLRLPPVQV